jgi:deazaflavin-dependent oxidoreductase (nitroreductase family)
MTDVTSSTDRPAGQIVAATSTNEPTGSRAWDRTFRVLFRTTPGLVLGAVRAIGIGPLQELEVTGRRTGRRYRVLAVVVERDGRWYAGHPNGGDAQWVRNLRANSRATLHLRGRPSVEVVACPLPKGAERDRVIDDIVRRQPPPFSLLYRLARRHVDAVGTYFRLEQVESSMGSLPLVANDDGLADRIHPLPTWRA